MDFGQAISNINFLAVIVAAFSAFFVGWIWYGPLFGKKWMELNGFTKENMGQKKWLPLLCFWVPKPLFPLAFLPV